MEIYKVINGSECYSVSNMGNVKTKNWRNTKKEAVLKPAKDKKGYLRVGLCINGNSKTFKVHRLVASAFISNPLNKPQVNHKDGNKSNNSIYNLEWVTCSENQIHAIKTGLVKIKKGYKRYAPWTVGQNNHNAILTEYKIIEIRKKFKPRVYTRKMLALEYGVKECTIKDIVLRKSWSNV